MQSNKLETRIAVTILAIVIGLVVGTYTAAAQTVYCVEGPTYVQYYATISNVGTSTITSDWMNVADLEFANSSYPVLVRSYVAEKTDTADVNVTLDFSHDCATSDALATVMQDSATATAQRDTMNILNGAIPAQAETARCVRWRSAGQTGNDAETDLGLYAIMQKKTGAPASGVCRTYQ